MKQSTERVVFPFTFIFTQEDKAWSALACEIDVASCGDTLDEARKELQDAVELYVSYMMENGLRDQIARPAPKDALEELCRGEHEHEYHVLIVDLLPKPDLHPAAMEFIRSAIAPVDCCHSLAGR